MSHAPLRSNVTTPFVVKCLAVNCLSAVKRSTYSAQLLANSLNDTRIRKKVQRITTYSKKLAHFLLLF